MGKALLIWSASDLAITSAEEVTLFGSDNRAATAESGAQANCTEGATFSLLAARIRSGNSGTATFQFRDTGVNGLEVVSFSGVGAAEDAVNTDVLSAGDLFNIAYTDTGTNSTMAWIKANVEFASGHGNFHGCAAGLGAVCDVPDATRFLSFAGTLIADGEATEDNAEWKNRGYTSIEALQVRVTANARTNDSTFRNRVNGADGTGVVTFAAGATGLVTDSVIGDALASGDTINASITLGTGVQDLTVAFVAATLKSSASKSESFCSDHAGLARTASATAHYLPIGGHSIGLTNLTEAQARIKAGFAAVVSNLRCYLEANTYTSNGTLKLYKNGVAVITTTLTASGGAGWYENATDTITIDSDDELSLELDEGGTGSITMNAAGITFAPIPGPVVEEEIVGLVSAIPPQPLATIYS